MRANKHLLLWSSVATLLIVIWAIGKENFFQDWRSIQRQVRSSLSSEDADRFEIKLRQIVAPKVGRTDRCVSCHVGMTLGEEGIEGDRLYGNHADVFHSEEDFGCTICHGGQGRATTTADAHGNVPYWPEPMLATSYLYAGCGTCHAYEGVPSFKRLREAEALVSRLGCQTCHSIGAAPTANTGPDLTLAGIRGFAKDWMDRHPPLPPISAQEGKLIHSFLASRVGAPQLVEAQATFNSLGCRGCHKVGVLGGDEGPALTEIGLKDPAQTPFSGIEGPRTMETFFKEHFRDPARVVAGSRMPRQKISEEEIERLTLYMFSLRRRDLPTGLWPKDRIRVERFGASGFADDGAAIFDALCVGCHGKGGSGGMANPNSVRKDFPPLHQLAELYQLYDREEVDLVIAELREHGALSADRPLDVPRWNITLAQDEMIRTVIEKGNPSGKEDPGGIAPIDMPSWGSVLDQRQITEVMIHLLSISELEDEDEEDDEDEDEDHAKQEL